MVWTDKGAVSGSDILASCKIPFCVCVQAEFRVQCVCVCVCALYVRACA